MFIGTLLLGMATSLPELLTAINAISQEVPNLSAGDFFGSSMFNMLILAILDLMHQQTRILRRVATQHALTAGMAIILLGLAVFFIQFDVDLQIGWLGVDSLVLMALYIYGIRLINMGRGPHKPAAEVPTESEEKLPSLKASALGFSVGVAVLVVATYWLVHSAVGVAEITGLSTGFVGVAMVAIVTSLPEVTSTLAAVRIGAFDLAIGNLFGSNMFNMFALGFADLFFRDGRLLSVLDPTLASVGLLGLVLTAIALVGNLAPEERRLGFIEIDALLILVVYGLGIWFLYSAGIG